jgi:hypothetical protein
MDIERLESHVSKWLSTNADDTTFLSDEKLRNLRIIR